MKLSILLLHYAFHKSCKDCVFIRHKFPNVYKCIYYDMSITEDHTNCTIYKRKNIDM